MHGWFLPWIEAEFGMTRMTASRFMGVAEKFGKSNTMLHLDPTALYELAAPSTPPEVQIEVERRIAAGEIISAADEHQQVAVPTPWRCRARTADGGRARWREVPPPSM
jgi:hypothetical protein